MLQPQRERKPESFPWTQHSKKYTYKLWESCKHSQTGIYELHFQDQMSVSEVTREGNTSQSIHCKGKAVSGCDPWLWRRVWVGHSHTPGKGLLLSESRRKMWMDICLILWLKYNFPRPTDVLGKLYFTSQAHTCIRPCFSGPLLSAVRPRPAGPAGQTLSPSLSGKANCQQAQFQQCMRSGISWAAIYN